MRSKKLTLDRQMVKRILMSLGGVVIGAVAVGIFKIAAFGVDPFQAFMNGLNALIPISFGTLYMICNALLLVFSLLFDRSRIGVTTFINLFLLGYVVDFSYWLFRLLLPDPALWVRVVCLIVGIVVLCIASAFYMTADLGVSTYDAVAIVMANKWHLGKFKVIRIITDVVCVALGVFFFLISGGDSREIFAFAGIGTIITAFFMGPLIQYFIDTMAVPILTGTKTNQKK